MGRDKKDKRKKKDKPADIVNIKAMDPKTGLIDAASIREYKSAYSQYKVQNGKESNVKLVEHIETRIHKTVEEQKKKRKRDITSVAASTAAGTMVPFSGVPIMVATTMVQCVGFSAALGLIPIANVRSFQDANTLATQLTSTLTKASSSGMKAAIEAFILEALKVGGFGSWLWEEILKDIVFEITSGVVTESAWVLTPLFAAPKYILHRKLIKKMYVAVGEKAIVVHTAWVNDHLFFGKPETEMNLEENVAALAASIPQTSSIPAAVPAAYPGFPSAYPAGYATTGQRLYESNSDDQGKQAPYPVYYQPAFASSAHGEARPREAAPAHSNSFPLHHPHSQYAYYPPSYPMHMPQGRTNPSSGSEFQQRSNGTPQHGTHGPPSYASSYSQQPPAAGAYSDPNPLVSHMHTSSTPNLLGPYGSGTNVSSDPGQNSYQAPPVGYPRDQQTQNGENGEKNNQSTPHQRENDPASANSAPNYNGAPPTAYPPQQNPNEYSYHGARNPSCQQAPPTGFSHPGHSQSEPPPGASAYSRSVQQSQFPSPYPANQQHPYGLPPVQYQQYSHAAPSGSYPPTAPFQKQAEAC